MDLTFYETARRSQASLAFLSGPLGFEVRVDVELRWEALDHGRARRPAGTSTVPSPPAAAPGTTDDERRTIGEMMARRTLARINITTDVDGIFERPQAATLRSCMSRPTNRTGSTTAPPEIARNLTCIQEYA